jgi:hypothetical protein
MIVSYQGFDRSLLQRIRKSQGGKAGPGKDAVRTIKYSNFLISTTPRKILANKNFAVLQNMRFQMLEWISVHGFSLYEPGSYDDYVNLFLLKIRHLISVRDRYTFTNSEVCAFQSV